MKSLLIPAGVLLLALLLFAGCSQPQGQPPASVPATVTAAGVPTASAGPAVIAIRATPDRYIPLMSTTVGIRLEPEFHTTMPVTSHWNASYGYFIAWNETDYRVTVLNASVRTTEPSIYWSYPPDDMGREKPPVTVRLSVGTERETVGFGDLSIGWEGNDTAIVRTP